MANILVDGSGDYPTTSSYCVANKFKVARAAKHLIAVCDILVRRNSAFIIKTPFAVDDNIINNMRICVGVE